MFQASGSHLDLSRAPYVLYGVEHIDLVSLAWVPGQLVPHMRVYSIDGVDLLHGTKAEAATCIKSSGSTLRMVVSSTADEEGQ